MSIKSLILVSLVAVAISTSASAGSLDGTVSIDGSSTVFPITEAVAEEYRAIEPRVRVTVGISGTGGGFKKFLAKEIDINDASRSIKDKELEKARKNAVNFIELPVAFDGISMVVSIKNTFVDYLTTAELKKIWQPGSQVKLWSDVRPHWPAKPVRLFGPGTDSGTFDYFTKTINGKEGASRADYTASEDDNVLVTGVSGDEYALGYFGYAYYAENKKRLTVVAIDNGAGPIAPSRQSINTGTYAPLSRPIFIYVNPLSLEKPQVASFVDFYIKNAASLANEVGYIGMPASVYQKALLRIKNRETGTAYTEDAEFKVPSLLD